MATVFPFRGLRYAPERLDDPGRVVSPPYDVIADEERDAYYARDRRNIIRLERPRAPEGGNPYRQAAQQLADWLDDGVLTVEARPAFYLLQETFQRPDTGVSTRTSFLAAVRLSDYEAGAVLPHEETMAGPIQDRLRLLEHAQTNISPIFSLYDAPDDRPVALLTDACREREPLFDFTDEDGTRQRLWVVTETGAVRRVQEALSSRTLYIADGHHRYETARRYFADTGGAYHHKPGWHRDRTLMVLTNLHDPGLVVLPTHRVVAGVDAAARARLKEGLEELGILTPLAIDDLAQADPTAAARRSVEALGAAPQAGDGGEASFGLLLPGEPPHLFHLRPREAMARLAPARSKAWRSLDVAVLHTLILEPLLGITPEVAERGERLSYTQDAAAACWQVHEDGNCVAVLLRPTPVEEVIAVAEAGENMPQKSTFFYPKFLTGLVMNALTPPPSASS